MTPEIFMMMNERAPQGKGGYRDPQESFNGFAFTFTLPAVPRIGDEVCYADRRFLIADVQWYPSRIAHTPGGAQRFSVVLLADELEAR